MKSFPLVRKLIRQAAAAYAVDLRDPAAIPHLDHSHPTLTELICLLSHVRFGLDPAQISALTSIPAERVHAALHFGARRISTDRSFKTAFHRLRAAA